MTKKRRYDLRLREGNITYEEKPQDTESFEAKSKFYRSVGVASELGFVIAFPLVGGILLGSYLDQKFSSYPKITLSLLLLGVMVSFCNLFLVMKEFMKRENKK
jgi:F0F1-type ATP synthase assembly protein I